MTTDLTGDFGVDEEELDWDVFLPDPDEAAMEAEAASLRDETELNLDDSDFDWEGALGDDADAENGAGDGARAGAAYDRIVDTVRGASEQDEPTGGAMPPAGDEEPALESGVDSEATWEDEPGWVPAVRSVAEPDPQPEAPVIADIDTPREPEQWPDLEQESVLGETDPEPEVSFEPEHEAEPVVPRFAEAPARGKSILQHAPNSPGALAYRELARTLFDMSVAAGSPG